MKFKNKFSITFSLITSLMLIVLSSCSEPNEKAHPAYQAALKAFENHNYPESATKFEKYLDFNRTSAKTHLKLAKLYGDYLDNPFLEAYHYRQYLVYEPQCSDKEDIEAWIEAAEKKFATKMIEDHPEEFTPPDEIDKLEETNKNLLAYMKKLKKELTYLRQLKGSTNPKKVKNSLTIKNKNLTKTSIASSNQQKNPSVKTYIVKKGDTLSKISKEIYGSSKYYRSIYQANSDSMRSESDLKIGMTLTIPDID